MKYIGLFLIVFILFLLTSCSDSKRIYFDFEDVEQKLVVNSVTNIDSVIKINIARVNSLNEEKMDFSTIKNADISIWGNDLLLGKVSNFALSDTNFNYGYYFNDNISISESTDSLKIIVKVENHTEVYAVDKIPTRPEIDTIYYSSNIDTNIYDNYNDADTIINRQMSVVLVLSDVNLECTDFFAVKVYYKKNNGYIENVFFETNNNQLFDTYLFGEGYIFSDSIFVNNQILLAFDIETDIPIENKNNIYFEVKSISKAYYNYLKSYKKSKISEQDVFSEYTDVSTNVEKGYGIFTVFCSKKYTLN